MSAIPRVIVGSKAFTFVTTVLTIYALVGDDIRLITTNMPADTTFDIFTVVCLVVFTAEIILSCLGKADYFMSFFFTLDIVSTATLLFDLSVVSDYLSGADEDIEPVTGGAGLIAQVQNLVTAKAGRVVRVLRLVRILKLYKAYYEAKQAKRRSEERKRNPGADDDNWDGVDIDVATTDVFKNQSRVGKKLSDRTTRQVILLVLVMMVFLPLLRVDSVTQFPTEPQYAAEYVHEAFAKYLDALEAAATPSDADYWKAHYETQLMQMVYYNNWWTKRAGSCPFATSSTRCTVQYDSQAFWVGIASKSRDTARSKAAQASISQATVDDYQELSSNEERRYNFGAMPDEVASILSNPWGDDCPHEKGLQRVGASLISVSGDGLNKYMVKCPSDLRSVEVKKYYAKLQSRGSWDDWHFAIYFDLRPWVQGDSTMNLAIMCFVCLSLLVSSITFSNDADTLVLHPVENMIAKVDTIRQSPLMAMKMADNDFKAEEKAKAMARKIKDDKWTRLRNKLLCSSAKDKDTEPMETMILEKTIIKLGSLLALGFGEAGAKVIQHNMHGVDSAAVDAMVMGNRVDCIIGVTRIRNFSTATEVLRAKVMTFVNQVAEIVHGVIGEFSGAANKNNGDTFLIVWRTSGEEPSKIPKMADMSMMAFTMILGAIHRSPVLAQYRTHPGLQQRLGKDCRIHLTSSLHFGWTIEGAVGSEFKIDASYLSPNVSIAETIERATRIYGVSILVAESVVSICTSHMAAKCRKIDRVVITGQQDPIDLFSIDVDYHSLVPDQSTSRNIVWNSRQRFKARQVLEADKKEKWSADCRMVSLFNDNADIATMRFRYTLEFLHVFNMGYQNYSLGEWEVAQKLLHRTRTMLGVEDGPSKALLLFMGNTHDFRPPPGWKGFRTLTVD